MLGVSFDKMAGPDATCSYKLVFEVDESQREGLIQIMNYKKGTNLLLFIFDNDEDLSSFTQETDKEAKRRFYNHMQVMINSIAERKKMKPEEVKTILKDYLKAKKLIKESTTELDLNGLSAAIYYLTTNFN